MFELLLGLMLAVYSVKLIVSGGKKVFGKIFNND